MKTRHCLVALAVIAAPQADVHGLTVPSASDGPIRLLTCNVSAQGILEASVESQADDAMDCSIRCNYELGDKMFSHVFSVTIPKRFQGRVGRFDTNGAKPGNYSGDLGTCRGSPA
ncbi:MAG: hypothetical protein ABI769_06560 [Pseudomonadota bacterium]